MPAQTLAPVRFWWGRETAETRDFFYVIDEQTDHLMKCDCLCPYIPVDYSSGGTSALSLLMTHFSFTLLSKGPQPASEKHISWRQRATTPRFPKQFAFDEKETAVYPRRWHNPHLAVKNTTPLCQSEVSFDVKERVQSEISTSLLPMIVRCCLHYMMTHVYKMRVNREAIS